MDTYGCVKGIWPNKTFPFGSTRIGGMVEGIVYKCSGEGIQEKPAGKGKMAWALEKTMTNRRAG